MLYLWTHPLDLRLTILLCALVAPRAPRAANGCLQEESFGIALLHVLLFFANLRKLTYCSSPVPAHECGPRESQSLLLFSFRGLISDLCGTFLLRHGEQFFFLHANDTILWDDEDELRSRGKRAVERWRWRSNKSGRYEGWAHLCWNHKNT